MVVIGFSGFAINGKSFIIDVVEGFIPKEFKVIKFPETARLVSEFIGIKDHFQDAILAAEINNFIILSELNEALQETYGNKEVVALTDRTLLDNIIFRLLRQEMSFSDAVDIIDTLVEKYLRFRFVYDQVYLIDKLTDREKIATILDKDPVRKQTLGSVEQFLIWQERFYQLWDRLFKSSRIKECIIRVDRVPNILEGSNALLIVSKVLQRLKEFIDFGGWSCDGCR